MKCILPVLITLLFFCGYAAYAQKNKPLIDSLERISKHQKDTTLVKTLSELTWQYRQVDRAIALDYGRKAIALARKTNFLKGLAQAYNDMGIIYYDREDYDSSIQLYNASLKIRQQLRDDLGVAKCYNKIGIVYQRQGDYSRALDNQLNALALFEKTKDNIGTSYALNNIGILHQNMSRYDDALEYHKRSIAIKQKINDRAGQVQSYVNMGNILKMQEKYPEAETYYLQALETSRELGNKEYLSNTLNNLGELYMRLNQPANALAYMQEALQLRKEIKDSKGMVSCLNNIGLLYIQLKQYDSSFAFLQEAESVARGSVTSKPELMSVYQSYSKLYEAMGETSRSLDFYKKFSFAKDSIYTDEMSGKFADMQTKYNTLEKEKMIAFQKSEISRRLYELAGQQLKLSQADLLITGNALKIKGQQAILLKQRIDAADKEQRLQKLHERNRIQELELRNEKLESNRKNGIIVVILILAVMSGLLFYSNYRRNKIKLAAQMQAQLSKQQELATMAILQAEEHERQRIGTDLHDGVGQIMSAAKINLSMMESELQFAGEDQRLAYEKIIALVDEGCKEVRTISHNMMPNALLKAGLGGAVKGFINQIDSRVINIDLYTEGLDEKLDSHTETILYRVVQECVNNVIKHAAATKLDISLIHDADGVAVMIEDNGKGFDATDRTKFEGIGLKNITSRISYLKGTVEWNSSPGNGAAVAVFIPAQHKLQL